MKFKIADLSVINKKYIIFKNKKKKLFIKYKILCIIAFGIILFISLLIKNSYNIINVAYALDINYSYIIHVSMKSIMLNQNIDTFINFHIVSSNVTKEQKTIINKICLEHNNCRIFYHIIGNQFNEFQFEGLVNWSKTIFYRLLLQDILPNENKVLYLDCDTLVYKDLNEIYNYDITDKYYTGMLEEENRNIKGYIIKYYINSGVLLINLDNLRKDNIYTKIIEYLTMNNNTLTFPDQDTINAVCNTKNGVFPTKYVIIAYCTMKSFDNNNIEIIKAYKDPYIIHYIIYVKPWKGITNEKSVVCYDPISKVL